MKFIKNYLFLASLIVVILLEPFLEEIRFGSLISIFLLSTSASLCLLMLSSRKHVFWILVVFSVLVIVFNFSTFLYPSETTHIFQYLSLTILFFLYAGLLFYFLMTSQMLSITDISNAISIYLLIGIAFGLLYSFLVKVYPGAISFNSAGASDISGEMIYFSFIAITTAGFGDIVPVIKGAKVLVMMEAIIGVLYIAIMIGRLVGLGQIKK